MKATEQTSPSEQISIELPEVMGREQISAPILFEPGTVKQGWPSSALTLYVSYMNCYIPGLLPTSVLQITCTLHI